MHFDQNFKCFCSFCNLFVFSFYRMGFLVKVSDLLEKLHQICWFSGCDLHLPEAPGLRKPLAILQCQKETSEIYVFWNFFWDFLKILYFLWLFIVPTGFPLQRKWFSWKKSTRFAGFLAIIFTSQWNKLQKFYASRKKSGDFLKNLHLFCVPKLL